jgi:hypothetical protein
MALTSEAVDPLGNSVAAQISQSNSWFERDPILQKESVLASTNAAVVSQARMQMGLAFPGIRMNVYRLLFAQARPVRQGHPASTRWLAGWIVSVGRLPA